MGAMTGPDGPVFAGSGGGEVPSLATVIAKTFANHGVLSILFCEAPDPKVIAHIGVIVGDILLGTASFSA